MIIMDIFIFQMAFIIRSRAVNQKRSGWNCHLNFNCVRLNSGGGSVSQKTGKRTKRRLTILLQSNKYVSRNDHESCTLHTAVSQHDEFPMNRYTRSRTQVRRAREKNVSHCSQRNQFTHNTLNFANVVFFSFSIILFFRQLVNVP